MRRGISNPLVWRTLLVMAGTAGVALLPTPPASAAASDRPKVEVSIKVNGKVEQRYNSSGAKRPWNERVQEAESITQRAAAQKIREATVPSLAEVQAAKAAKAKTAGAFNPLAPASSNPPNSAGPGLPANSASAKQPLVRVDFHSDEITSTPLPPSADPASSADSSDPAAAAAAPAPKPLEGFTVGDDYIPFPRPKSVRQLSAAWKASNGQLSSADRDPDRDKRDPDRDDVDPYGTLRNFNKIADELGSRRYGSARGWQGERQADLGGENRNPGNMGGWHSQSDPWQRTAPADIEVRSTFDGELREMPLRDFSGHSHQFTGDSRFAGTFADQLRKFSALADHAADTRFQSAASSLGSRRYGRPLPVNNFSMQGINRYQFRRTHSTQQGFPVVAPGKDVNTGLFQPGQL